MRKAGVLLLLVLFGCSGSKLDKSTAEGLAKRILSSNPARFSSMWAELEPVPLPE